MRHSKKNGFTLTELIVVLVIFVIIVSMSAPFFMNYWKRAEFRKNESQARTVYLAAESKLTYYRSTGQWDAFLKRVKEQGIVEEGGNSNIYAITLNKGTYQEALGSQNALLELVDDYTYDKEVFDAAIALEIDVESGEVYSAFYGSRCTGLSYGEGDSDGYLTMKDRAYESRRERLLGYYSAKDTVNRVSLDSKKLRITTLSLQNGEKLSLNWSSNLGDKLDVSYEITFYTKTGDQNLFGMVVSPYDLRKAGWAAGSSGTEGFATVTLKDASNQSGGDWAFPMSYGDNKYSLVLDAMMSADTIAMLESRNDAAYDRSLNTSILRLAAVAEALKEPQQIYATVKATSYAGIDPENPIMQEYKDSETASSNSAHTLYGDRTENEVVQVATFRHLSNIRYYEKKKTAVFQLTEKNMDWASVGTGVYELSQVSQNLKGLSWKDNSRGEAADFPTIPQLNLNHTLQGSGNRTLISNLCLGETSVIDDGTANSLSGSKKTEYLGLFGELYGKAENLTFQNAVLSFGMEETFSTLKGIGLLAGRSEGTVSKVTFAGDKTEVSVSMEKAVAGKNAAAVGGVVGIFAGLPKSAQTPETELTALTEGALTEVTMNGTVAVKLPKSPAGISEEVEAETAKKSMRGIGGIVGYAKLSNNETGAKIAKCTNHADVNGNLFTGGIAGNLEGDFTITDNPTEEELVANANLRECENDGLILCTDKDGRYFGGIVGYGHQALIHASESAAGQSGNAYQYERKEELLLGSYVGGIIGYGNQTLLTNCATKSGGYVLGSDYVGGIAGGLGGMEHAIRAHGGVSVTTNGNYVIGNSYVGGIVGDNAEHVVLKDCINNGVAVGYRNYAGGIVGHNANGATIENCASYLSDYDSSIYQTVVKEWKAEADYVGGIAGYNDGNIKFDANSEKITVKSVSSIVAGKNYVGGVIGMNDEQGTLDVGYTLIGGRIYASGNCAGGAIGFNRSLQVLEKNLRIRPRSVNGTCFVGGCIGANLVNLTENIEVTGLSSDNPLGEIDGTAFCGGVIGYLATCTEAQLLEATSPADLLPKLEDRVPTYETGKQNDNNYTITIKTTNNIPIHAQTYVGGIVGYCEKNSKVTLKECKNTGNLRFVSASGQDGEVTDVNLGKFAQKELYGKTLSEEASKLQLHFAGGIIGVNLKNHIVENSTNTGSISGFLGIGGIVGLNDGKVFDCQLTENFGNASLDYIGGIVGLNTGEIESCKTTANKTLSGNNQLGGIVGWNLNDGVLKECVSQINITAQGSNIGGIAGRNSGSIEMKNCSVSGTISSTRGSNIGGIVGSNENTGKLSFTDVNGDCIAVTARITGYENVGGIAGTHKNVQAPLGTETANTYLVSQAALVRAIHGNAGGIVGETNGNIKNAKNRSGSVTADAGLAGGITAVNGEEHIISGSINCGSVSSSYGNAGGIAAENAGSIVECTVKGEETETVMIYSLGVTDSGAICAVNTGTIKESKPEEGVCLSGSAKNYGGITGKNTGTVTNVTIEVLPKITSSSRKLTVGTAAGINEGTISWINAGTEESLLEIKEFPGYQYLGGIAGVNGQTNPEAVIQNCTFAGVMEESPNTGAAGNCYGGVAGINYGRLQDNQVNRLTMTIQGVYTANSSSTAQQKEAQATHVGGIAGKNETTGRIVSCYLMDNENSSLTAEAGMLGGVAGFNKGTIQLSGSEMTKTIMNGVTETTNTETLHQNTESNISRETGYINLPVNTQNIQIEDLEFSVGTTVSDGKLKLLMTANGNVGGITAFNGTTGDMDRCVSGNWFLNNKSQAIGVGTGGIIGVNESEKDLSYLVNGAFVGRQLKSADTNRFAGGIIGNQNNSTTSDWEISHCINYGYIYCYNSHYSGGIIGQWTGGGGTIENCRNYGSLQTTHQAPWIGASGGIVAQLYHAFEDHEYNIISCANYGNIYGKSGNNNDQCANDSAGILGNITTYQASAQEQAQQFTVRILDCLNGPGVEIYSYSMASGIFGFLSCDNANAPNIMKSTAKVKIEIERCRNLATKLWGQTYVGGIFGSRYDGWSNLTLKDCYSANLGNESYNWANNPIYSNGTSWENYGTPAQMRDQNRVNNLFFDATNHSGYAGISCRIGFKTTEGTLNPGSESIELNQRSNVKFGDYIDYVKVMKAANQGEKYYFLQFYQNPGQISLSDYYIDEADGMVKKVNNSGSDEIVGEVLFSTEQDYKDHENMYKIATVKTVEAENDVLKYSRESYLRLEGRSLNSEGICQLIKPQSVTTEIENGRIRVMIIPAELANKKTADPFKYEVLIRDEQGTQTVVKTLYEESGSFDIPEGLSGTLQVSVRAVSMFEDVLASETVESNVTQDKQILPAPEVRAELVIHEFDSNNRDYRYKYSLSNLEDYQDYSDWQVNVSLKGYTQSVTLTAENPEGIIDIGFNDKRYSDDNFYQILAYATSNGVYQDSAKVSTSAYLPFYRASIPLAGDNSATPGVTITGNTLEDLNITVTLDNSSSTLIKSVQPIYRAELLGTWQEKENVVLSKMDVMAVSGGKSTATMGNLPEYIEKAKDLHIRIWFSQPGLGPVYTYHISDSQESGYGVEIPELLSIDENGVETWQYTYSAVFEAKAKYNWYDFQDQSSNSGTFVYDPGTELLTWLPKPELKFLDGTKLDPTYDAQNRMQYTFSWDQNVAAENAAYQIELTGLDSTGKEVIIDTSSYQGGNTYTADGEDWNFTHVRLKVTRLGDAKTGEIGLSTTATYQIAQRLEQPGQPSLVNENDNELIYAVSWSKIPEETYCSGYEIFLQVYGENNELQLPVSLGTAEKAEQQNGTYRKEVDLEAYAGKRVIVYLVAKTSDSQVYVDSVNGVTYELEIPIRLNKPVLEEFSASWTYGKNHPVEANYFAAGTEAENRLRLNLKADIGSIPPGGSGYLLKAYIYGQESDLPENYLLTYPQSGEEDLIPIQMDMKDSQNYYHFMRDLSIRYAGKWIEFYTRISAGDGNISSPWVQAGQRMRLPYVKLETPQVQSDSRSFDLTVEVDDTPNMPTHTETWIAEHTVLQWSSVECADVYTIGLTGGQNLSANLRVVEKSVDGELRPVLQELITGEDGSTKWMDAEAEASVYSLKVQGNYTTKSGVLKSYTLTLKTELLAEEREDGGFDYTLKLPDVTSMKDEDENVIVNEQFSLTKTAEFAANVTANVTDQDTTINTNSDAYVGSDSMTIEWQNNGGNE